MVHARTCFDLLQLGRELGSAAPAHTSGPFGCSTAARAMSTGVDSSRQPPLLCLEPGGRDLAAQAGHRRRVDRREPERHRPAEVAQLAPGQRRGEQDVDVAAAGRRRRRRGPGRRAGRRARRSPRPAWPPRRRHVDDRHGQQHHELRRATTGSRSSASIRPGGRAGVEHRHHARLTPAGRQGSGRACRAG